jgi:zinc protease
MSRKKITIYKVLLILGAVLFLCGAAIAAPIAQGVERLRLKNGITLLVKENRSSPVASLQVWLKSGSADEYEKEAGITHFIEHMIFKGTPARASGEIARAVEESGGSINAYTSLDRTVYFVEIASSRFRVAIEVLMDALKNSLFDPQELEREREVILEEYRRSLDMPMRKFHWALMELSYKRHPYRRPVIGYESTIRSIKREDILSYVERRYLPENIVIVALGDFDSKEIVKVLKREAEAFPPRGKIPSAATRLPEPEQDGIRTVVMSEDVQHASISLSWRTPSIHHPDTPALDLAAVILADGRTSRLEARLRMKERLVHSVDADTSSFADDGLFSIGASLDEENLQRVLEAISQEVLRLVSEPVTEQELARAKALLEAAFLKEMDTMGGRARTFGFFETIYGDVSAIDRYLAEIRCTRPEDIMRAASLYLRPERLSAGLMRPKGSKAELSEAVLARLFSTRNSAEGDRKANAASGARLVLPNGVRVVVRENKELPLVSMTGCLLGGSRLEGSFPWGISNMVSEMLTRGTTTRSAEEISTIVESRGGSLSAFSGQNALGISATFLSRDFRIGLELMADLLSSPSFDAGEMEKVRQDLIASVRAKKDNPAPQLFDLFYKTLFTSHPYGHPQTGTEETLAAIKREDLLKWYAMIADPSRLVISIVGDIDASQAFSLAGDIFSRGLNGGGDLPPVPREPPIKGVRTAHLERPAAQTHMALGYLGWDVKSPREPAMAVLETALSGMGGRLFVRLRDQESLAYSVTAFRRSGPDAGLFGIYIACNPAKAAKAKESIFRELRLLRDEGLTAEELEGAKRYLLGETAIGLQKNSSRALRMALDELYQLGYDHVDRFMEQVERLDLKDIKETLADLLKDDNFILVTVGPSPK